jgi:diazepam-binding inhibitor (GABA receptor modulator, acyl-CoA-binding protein)
MSVDKELHEAFKKAYTKASSMKHSLPQDVMLSFYAYYKQATAGDNFSFNANLDIRNAFKFNAWMQLKGISSEEAKIKYIELVNKYQK